ncbi:HlyC/CorC family transporter [Methylosoma difficile]
MPIGMLFGILAVMLVLSAFFSGSESALMTLSRYRLRHLANNKHAGAIKAKHILQKPDRLLGLILLGNNFVNNLAAAITTVIALKFYADDHMMVAAAIGLLTLIMLVFSEATPKTLAAAKPELLAFPAAWIYSPLLKVFYPLIWLVNGFVSLLLRLFSVNLKKNRQDFINIEEFQGILNETEQFLPARYQNMLQGILDLESATVEDIMTPRHEIIGIDLEASIEDIITDIKTSPHTQLVAYKNNIDKIVGFLHLRNVLVLLEQVHFDKHALMELISKPVYIPEHTPVYTQMLRFSNDKSRIGLVVDEYGDVQGLVTLDDLLQEIAGGLLSDDLNSIKKQSDGSLLVDANITVRELNRLTHWSLPTNGPKTLNGLIIEFMETIPKAGTSIKLHGHPLEIVKHDDNTVKLVKFLPAK